MATARASAKKEIWKSPPSLHKPWVEVSNLGRVRTLDHISTFMRKGSKQSRKEQGRILKVSLDSRGRPLFCNGDGSSHLVRVLVAECFVPNDLPKVNKWVFHKDGDARNCNADNLTWGRKRYDFYMSGRPVGVFLYGETAPYMVGSLCKVAEHLGCSKQAVHYAIMHKKKCRGADVAYLPKGTKIKPPMSTFPKSLYGE